MGLLFKNNAETTLSSGINDSVTTVPVTSAAVFPTPDANNVFFATIDDGTNIEVVKVTAISSNDLTVVRAQDNTSASAFSSGAKIELRLTAKVLEMGTSSLTDLDGDTAIFVEQLDDEDQIRMDTGGNQRVLINSDGLEISSGNISNASGDLILDVSGDIILDADGGDILFKDGGTLVGTIGGFSGSNVVIKSEVSNKDVIFQGNDGGSGITALTLDMSDAGSAYFNNKVGIGTTSPAYMLDVSGGSGTMSRIQSGGSSTYLAIKNTSNTGFIGIDGTNMAFYPTATKRGNLDTSGNFVVSGNVTAYGSPSDIKLKEDIEVIDNALDKVKQLKGITYTLKSDRNRLTGLIAQDLEKVLPEAVYETTDVDDDDKHLAIRYGNTVGLLVEAIKELEARVKELEDK